MKIKYKSKESKYLVFILVLLIMFECCLALDLKDVDTESNPIKKNQYRTSNNVKNNKNHIHHNAKKNSMKKRQEKSETSEPFSTMQLISSFDSSSSSKVSLNSDEPDFDYTIGKYQKDRFNYDVKSQYDLSSSASLPFSSGPISRPPNSLLTNVTVVLGQNALLSCAVKNLGSHNILWLRVRDGDVLAYDDMLISQDPRIRLLKKTNNESSLFIQNVKLSDSGEYACQINTHSVKSKFINLIILTPPVFTEVELNNDLNSLQGEHWLALASSLPNSKNMNSQTYYNHLQTQTQSLDASTKSVQVIETRPVTLECHAFGNPKPTINWYVKRFKSANLTVYSLNTNKIVVNNVMRKQYEYFECEATNKLPPSISKKFKINVLYRPELTVTPAKIYVNKVPTQVRFNCTLGSYPMGTVYWTHNFKNKRANAKRNKKSRETIKKSNSANKTGNGITDRLSRKLGNRNLADQEVSSEQMKIINYMAKYSVNEQLINETYKIGTILINVENDDDFGLYECFSNNTAGHRAVKFYIYGDQFKPILSTTPNIIQTGALSNNNNKNRQLESTRAIFNLNDFASTTRMFENEENLMIDEKLIKHEASKGSNREIQFDLTTLSNLQVSSLNRSSSLSIIPITTLLSMLLSLIFLF